MESDWENLPEELLDLVFKRLVLHLDSLRFAVVCKSWYWVSKNKQINSVPMLLIPDRQKDTWNLCDVTNDKVLKMQLRWMKKRFCGSSKGWLIVCDENFVVTLINPSSRVKGRKEKENSIVRLPPLDPPGQYRKSAHAKHCEYFVYKATISADPISNANDCIVVVIYNPRCELAFIRLGDNKWTYFDETGYEIWCLFEDIAQIGDKSYVVTSCESQLLTFEYTTQRILNINLVAPCSETEEYMKAYLVGSNEEELLLVHRYTTYTNHCRVTNGFRIFKLNYDTREWIEKNDLGDFSLFVGDNSSISVVASKIQGCESNCIYFYADCDRIVRYCPFTDFGVYNVKSQRILKPAHVKTLMKKLKQPPIWFLPSVYL
ncbi:putative F-box protein At5g55150 [Prunus avium]|uniref:F-box protein At5g55150 n=1 Tax=Prunus avium TaxID=42229 RepID=A0A6P5T7Z2_PRUAV|nr:putative F-box protein At5g55150 [Prunus avium]